MDNTEQDIRQFIETLQKMQLKFLEKGGRDLLLCKLMGGMAATTSMIGGLSKSEFLRSCGEAWDSYEGHRNRS